MVPDAERAAHIADWLRRLREPGFAEELNAIVREAIPRGVEDYHLWARREQLIVEACARAEPGGCATGSSRSVRCERFWRAGESLTAARLRHGAGPAPAVSPRERWRGRRPLRPWRTGTLTLRDVLG